MKLTLISGTSNRKLAEEISAHIGVALTKTTIKKFKDGEIYIKINESIRGNDVFIIQSTCGSANDNLMELLIIIDALKRASASRITAVMPYYGYARQDRKAEAREAITAKLVADLITTAGANRIVTIDLHAPQIQGFFNMPVDELTAISLFGKYFIGKKLKDVVIIAPDTGSVKRARILAKILNAPIAIVDKRRTTHNECEVMHIVGDIDGKCAIIMDDMIDTGGTIINACNKIAETASSVYICASHPVFSDNAGEKLEKCRAKEVVITNTIPYTGNGKIKVISVAPLLSNAILNINQNKSVSTLFEQIMLKHEE